MRHVYYNYVLHAIPSEGSERTIEWTVESHEYDIVASFD